MDKDKCKELTNNPTVNPLTRRKIKTDGPTYKKLLAECDFINLQQTKDIGQIHSSVLNESCSLLHKKHKIGRLPQKELSKKGDKSLENKIKTPSPERKSPIQPKVRTPSSAKPRQLKKKVIQIKTPIQSPPPPPPSPPKPVKLKRKVMRKRSPIKSPPPPPKPQRISPIQFKVRTPSPPKLKTPSPPKPVKLKRKVMRKRSPIKSPPPPPKPQRISPIQFKVRTPSPPKLKTPSPPKPVKLKRKVMRMRSPIKSPPPPPKPQRISPIQFKVRTPSPPKLKTPSPPKPVKLKRKVMRMRSPIKSPPPPPKPQRISPIQFKVRTPSPPKLKTPSPPKPAPIKSPPPPPKPQRKSPIELKVRMPSIKSLRSIDIYNISKTPPSFYRGKSIVSPLQASSPFYGPASPIYKFVSPPYNPPSPAYEMPKNALNYSKNVLEKAGKNFYNSGGDGIFCLDAFAPETKFMNNVSEKLVDEFIYQINNSIMSKISDPIYHVLQLTPQKQLTQMLKQKFYGRQIEISTIEERKNSLLHIGSFNSSYPSVFNLNLPWFILYCIEKGDFLMGTFEVPRSFDKEYFGQILQLYKLFFNLGVLEIIYNELENTMFVTVVLDVTLKYFRQLQFTQNSITVLKNREGSNAVVGHLWK